jgi:hypothetical protein
MNPESHLRYHRERHADLLREDAALAPNSPGVRHLAYAVRGPAQARPRVGRGGAPVPDDGCAFPVKSEYVELLDDAYRGRASKAASRERKAVWEGRRGRRRA